MNLDSCTNIRNIGVIAHVDAGKTTLTERILLETGSISFPGLVHEGTTSSDYLLQERERGISIISAALSCKWHGHLINIVDTPGHIDFTAEVERTLRVMDAVITVFCAVHGVQAQSETVWRRARRYSLPTLAYVNKMDREGADFNAVLAGIRKRFAVPALPMQIPVFVEQRFVGAVDLFSGKPAFSLSEEASWFAAWQSDLDAAIELESAREYVLECLAELDDEVLRCYLNNEKPGLGVMQRALRDAVAKSSLIPVFCGSALVSGSVPALLDAVCRYLPGPGQTEASLAACICKPENQCDSCEPFCALVFNQGRLSHADGCLALRLYSGTVKPGMRIQNMRTGKKMLVHRVLRIFADDYQEIEAARAGDIVGLDLGQQDCRTGDTFCQEGFSCVLESMSFPEPVLHMNLAALREEDSAPLAEALQRLTEEDPSLQAQRNIEGTWRLAGMGELHLQIVQERLQSDYGLQTRSGQPQVKYKDSIAAQAEVSQQFSKQMPGGQTYQASLSLTIKPLPRGAGVHIDCKEISADLPPNCQQAVRQGIEEIVESGVPGGQPLTDISITAWRASYDAREASELAFLSVTRLALQDALQKAGRIELEPVMRVEMSLYQDHVGKVLADLTARRGRVTELDSLALGEARITALVPLAEMFGYASDLRSLCAGRAQFSAEPSSYEKRPDQGKTEKAI
ncbi:MAG: elongation factor G [Lentisphaeria bacterium]|nr:elongation factor G [Lentisphaeria bacterium]MDY0176459.1 elongation factor G [Lentisphaeria bacterium]NLZ60724.1 elongation factor G [Lentisphaerota bacterium]